jgi:hypothetical protein
MFVMGFGLCNVLTTFSRLMNNVLKPYINKFVFVYYDDMCIYSETHEQHIEHVRLVLQKLREHHQLFIKMPKYFWGRKETKYLGITVGNGSLRTSPDKISSVRDWPLQETQKQFKSFVQFFSYFGKFIHHFSDYAAPLTNTCHKNLHGNVVHIEATKSAFETLKYRMNSAESC